MDAKFNIVARNPTQTLGEMSREVQRSSIDSAGNSNVKFDVTDSYLGMKGHFKVRGINYIPKTATISVTGDFDASNVQNIICDSGYTVLSDSIVKQDEESIQTKSKTATFPHAIFIKQK